MTNILCDGGEEGLFRRRFDEDEEPYQVKIYWA